MNITDKIKERQQNYKTSKLKKYNPDKNVYEASIDRIKLIFDNFKYICVSFSGGKDSSVMLNLAIDEARKRNRRIGVMIIDIEANFTATVDFMKEIIEENKDVLDVYWFCLPMLTDNTSSHLETTWKFWDPNAKEYWVKPMPTEDYVINLDNYKERGFGFFYDGMTFEKFVELFGEAFGRVEAKKAGVDLNKDEVAILVGIKTDESLNRFAAISNKGKDKFKGTIYSTRINEYVFNFYPIYDWRVDDIFIYYAKTGKKYNQIYDLMYRAGVSPWKMRIDEPFGNGCKAGIKMFKVLEPETWAKLCSRVMGANMAALYQDSKIMKGKFDLPGNHTWKSFTKFLLKTLPKETAENYMFKFKKFIRWWKEKGSGLTPETIKELEKTGEIIRTGELSNRGNKDKEVVKFKSILDFHPLDKNQSILTWRRMCMCILRNDYICTRLDFSITNDLTAKQKEVVEKYKKVL